MTATASSGGAPEISSGAPVVLIERDATGIGGHWYPAALALTRAARHRHHPVVVIALGGIDPHAHTELTRAGAEVITRPPWRAATALLLLSLARLAHRASTAARRVTRHRRFPHQITLLARCATESAALRLACRERGAVPILLTASEGLPGLAALLGGAHVRITHDVITTQDRPLQALDRLTCRSAARVAVVCPTPAVRDKIAREHPGIPTLARPFALAEATDRITEDERATARARLGIAPDQTVVTLLGGWWPHKDIATVDAALHQLVSRPFLLVAGTPMDEEILARWRGLCGPEHLAVRHHALSEPQLREAFAATDLLLVARRAGTTTESGLVCAAARHGVALLVSDHDERLCHLLNGQRWVRIFTTGAPDDLASVIDQAIIVPPVRPGTDAAVLLGLSTPDDTIGAYIELHRSLPGTSARKRTRAGAR